MTPALDDPARIQAIVDSGLLETTHDPALDRLTELAGTMLGVAQCTLCLVLPDRQYFASRWDAGEPGERETPISHSYCQHVVTMGEPLVVPDAREDPLLRDNPAIADYDAIAYLGYPLSTADGTRLGTVCAIDHEPRAWTDDDMRLMRAFTGVVAAELEMRRVRAQADSNISRDAFAAAVHELRTPLTSIAGFASTLSCRWDDFPDEQRREFVAIIDEQAQRLTRLVDDLLMQSRIESGQLQPTPEPVRLLSLAEDVARGFRQVDVSVRGDEEARAFVDRGQVEQVLVNLVSNAVKYGSPPVVIEVHCEVRDSGEAAMIRVVDAGPGVPREFEPQLFQRYSQADGRRHAKGSGLGLWIVRELSCANGGDCRYEPNPECGATFVVELPAARESIA